MQLVIVWLFSLIKKKEKKKIIFTNLFVQLSLLVRLHSILMNLIV